MPEPASPRPRCYRCMRPLRLCLCGGLPTVPTRTRIVVLQHPQEHRHPFGSARFVRLCLPNSELHVAYGGLTGDLLTPIDVPPDTAVLYPHPRATDLAALPAAARPGTLLVLDGTWAHAKRLHAMNPWLQRLRHVRFVPRVPSRYRIRREPHADCVSTIEATVEALHLLEPETPGLEALVAAFERMIDQQVEHTASVPRTGRSKRERQREARRLSPLLADPRLVVAYAESSLPGGDESAERQLVQWVAVQTGGGEVFEALLRPRGVWPTDCHLEHMGIRPGELAAGHDEAAARAAFLAWAGPGAPVATWTRSSLDWGRVLLPPGTPTLVLKTQYCNLRNRAASFLESVVAREGLATVPLGCRGRARERLGNALAAARWLAAMRAELRRGE